MSKKKILWVADWNLNKYGETQTGYGNISDYYATRLYKKYNLIALGFAYLKNEHNYLFSLTLAQMPHMSTAIQSINEAYNLDYIVCCADIPIQRQLLKIPRKKTKYISIFAVEAPPVYPPWAMDLAQADYQFAISEFGKDECNAVGIEANHLVCPVDREIWKPKTVEEQQNIKDILGVKDKIVLFVNAAGNERKNISSVVEALRDLPNRKDYYLYILTNINNGVSWDLAELVNRFDLNKNVTIMDKGLSREETRRLYVAADFFINISKAEGMCYPILESMSVGTPVIATNCTAMKEHIQGGRGIAIEPDFKLIDPFGNTDRYYVTPQSLTQNLIEYSEILRKNPEQLSQMVEKAQVYVDERNSKNSIEMLEKIINE